MARRSVLLATEGTYPHHNGGVSTWCDTLIRGMGHVDYTLFAVVMNPFVARRFRVPENTVRVIEVPLWGTEEPSEHITDIPFSQVLRAKARTTPEVTAELFLPCFTEALRHILALEDRRGDFGRLLYLMHCYLQQYDYKESMKSELVWARFLELVRERADELRLPSPSMHEMTECLGWLYRFLTILNTPVPKVDLVHSSAAAFCGLPGVIAKVRDGTPFLLTEHGVYIREQYLAAALSAMPPFTKRFFLGLVSSVACASFAYADIVSPVCTFNTRWETRLGVPAGKLRVIPNGVDPAVFSPGQQAQRDYPCVVTVARISPLKDIETLVRTAALVKSAFPGVRFKVFGDASDRPYLKKCTALRDAVGLGATLEFAGHTDTPADVYRQGDVVLLTSVSEGFPYTVIEAMMCGRAIVATDVGGVGEALGGCGLMANPRDPVGLASACKQLLADPIRRASIAQAARERALSHFTTQECIRRYEELYKELGARSMTASSAANRVNQGYSLLHAGMYDHAIPEFMKALSEEPTAIWAPALLAEIAAAQDLAGDAAMSHLNLERAQALDAFLKGV